MNSSPNNTTSSDLSKFDYIFNGKSLSIIKENDELWFIGKEICDILEYKNANDMLKKHCRGVSHKYTPIQTSSGIQNMRIIEESDLYRLIMRSKMKRAIEFQDWVVKQVLPSIRKHGMYATNETIAKIKQNPNLINEMLEDIKTKNKLIEDQKIEIQKYPIIHFIEEEQNRINILIDMANKITPTYLDIYNTCYVRVLNIKTIINNEEVMIFKFGKSNCISNRLKQHKTEYKNSHLISIFLVSNNYIIENMFKEFLQKNNILINPNTDINLKDLQLKKSHKEFFYTRPDLNINKVINEFYNICIPFYPILNHDKKIETLQNKVLEYESKFQNIQDNSSQLLILSHEFDACKSKYKVLKIKYKECLIECEKLKNLGPENKILHDQLKISKIKEPSPTSNIELQNKEKVDILSGIKKICIKCDTPYDISMFPKWKLTGRQNHSCNNCFNEDCEIIEPIISNEKIYKCTTCGYDKLICDMSTNNKLCKTCMMDYRKARQRVTYFEKYIKKYEVRLLNDIGKKMCIECKEIKDTNLFNKSKCGMFGLEAKCYECRKKNRIQKLEKTIN
jgi:prophage antirepressor-like protein